MSQRASASRADRLREEMALSPSVSGKVAAALEGFLKRKGIRSLAEVTLDVELSYYQDLVLRSQLRPRQRNAYYTAFETCMYGYLSPQYAPLEEQIKQCGKLPEWAVKKLSQFLMLCDVKEIGAIDYAVRRRYTDYLIRTGIRKIDEYVKMLDWLKLYDIRNRQHPLKKARLLFEEKPVFLLSHPDYQTALSFYYRQDKEELLFDFSLPAPQLLKKQIFSMLNHALELEGSRVNIRTLYLFPLRLLYLYCVEAKVEDIEQMEAEQMEGFRESLLRRGDTKTDMYMQIIGRTRKFLFLDAPKTNWNANVWYLERFSFKGERMNPARRVESMHFYLVKNRENRRLLQQYMKYSFGVSSQSIGRIRVKYYNIYQFLQYCDEKGIRAVALTAGEFQEYITAQQEKAVAADTYNNQLDNINQFYQFLLVRGYINRVPFQKRMYFKKTFPVHHNRSVPEEVQGQILSLLKIVPEDIRLMYLHLWCLGLRMNEVCCLKADGYFLRDDTAWLRVYQYKMKTEKTIPIPDTLYRLMRDYIERNHREPDAFVFQRTNGQAYSAGVFYIRMKEICKAHGISYDDHIFRTHDYRHTVASRMYDSGASLQAVRDFLGHLEEDMTKQYLDYIPEQIEAANEDYFTSNSLVGKLEKRKEEAMEWKGVSM